MTETHPSCTDMHTVLKQGRYPEGVTLMLMKISPCCANWTYNVSSGSLQNPRVVLLLLCILLQHNHLHQDVRCCIRSKAPVTAVMNHVEILDVDVREGLEGVSCFWKSSVSARKPQFPECTIHILKECEHKLKLMVALDMNSVKWEIRSY